MKLGSLFSGYGGLERGVQAVIGTETAWVSDIDKGACRILAHRYPDVPNLGDISTIDWSSVEPVDVLTGGFPCQDVSTAGKRLGMRPDTRSGLWTQMAYAIDQLRPALVVAENVRGLLSAEAHSDLEPCSWCLGDGRGPDLRALGAVLGDLAELGYDASWYGLRAADVGAPHGRFRVFVVASPADAGRADWGRANPGRRDVGRAHDQADGRLEGAAASVGGDRTALLPTPAVNDMGEGKTVEAWDDMGEGKTVEAWDEWTAKMKAAHGNGNGHGASLAIEAQRLLPTPTSMDSHASGGGYNGQTNVTLTDATVRKAQDWGIYADAIARWESLTRPAPAPTQPSKKGTPQLSPAFSEWMQGLSAGWVTDVPGLTRNEMLKALGNGVVPQQCEAALRFLLTTMAVAA